MGLSDHRCQVLEVDAPVIRPPHQYKLVRSLHSCPWNEVRESLSMTPWQVMDL